MCVCMCPARRVNNTTYTGDRTYSHLLSIHSYSIKGQCEQKPNRSSTLHLKLAVFLSSAISYEPQAPGDEAKILQ